MTERVLVRDLPNRTGTTVRVCGWAHAVGASGVVLRDHTGLVELVAGDELPSAPRESAIEAEGTVVDGPDRLRIEVRRLRVVGRAVAPPPVDDGSPVEDRLAWRHLDLRHPRNRLVFEVQTTVERAMRDWWATHGFIELHSPKLRAMPNMSGRDLFALEYFDRVAYLAQSPQFYKQMAMAAGLERVFEIGPVFRANPLVTPRHDTEFVSVDVEVSWIESHEDLMALEEEWLCSVVAAVEGEHGKDVSRLFGATIRVPDRPFPRVTMAEAHEILAGRGHRPSVPGGDIDAEGERLLGEHVAAAFGHELVFVTEYPDAVRPFYHMRLDDGSGLTRSFDLLWNGLEVTTGAQREHRHDRLLAQAGRNPARVEVVRPYLDFFLHGCPPHGGFGLGLTRLLMCLLRVDDVREVTFLHRDRNRLSP
ncbi:MAG: aspartate--tRNA(Asn) ligase [Actinomycetota bacterium]|nr:aspartate--tRNA(Asn) ligase [Actinomycetota bacterium]